MLHSPFRATPRSTRGPRCARNAAALLLMLVTAPGLASQGDLRPVTSDDGGAGTPPTTAPDPVASRREMRRTKARHVADALDKTVAIYGFIKADVAVSVGSPESYGRPNASAITAAGNPMLAADADATSFSFQVAQSRLGVKVAEGRSVRGQIELDFIDFEKSSPTVASVPRLRQAVLAWDPAPHHTVFLGQTWDIVAPLMPHHFNLVGANFQAGNLGFMRPQVGWRYQPATLAVGLAVGLPSANTGPSIGPVELGPMPTFAATIGWTPTAAFALHLSGLFTQLAPTPDERLGAWVVALSTEATTATGFNLRAEAYIGQNTANLGMLTLSQGRVGVDLQDAGGFLSMKYAAHPHAAPYLTAGGAAVLRPDDVVSAYAPATETSGPTRTPASGPGIRWNVAARLGLEVPVIGGLAFQAEAFAHLTDHQLAAQDAALSGLARSFGCEGGAIYRF